MTDQTSVIPLLASSVNWAEFIKNVAALVGRSPTSSIDSSKMKLSDYARFIVTLGEFQSGTKQDALEVLRNNDYLLKHLSFGFLISGSSTLIFRVMELTDLDVTTAKGLNKTRVAVVSGTILEWKRSIITCLDQRLISNHELRWVFNNCLDYLCQAGLRNIFDCYRRKGLEDKTFLLEYKR